MNKNKILKIIKGVEGFEDLPYEQLNWLISKSERVSLNDGEMLFEHGSPVMYMYIILSGKILIKLQQNGDFKTIGEYEKQSITGGLPYSRAKEAIGSGISVGKSEIMKLHKSYFEELIKNHFELTRALVHLMTTRVREFTKMQLQNDKMMSLGKLSAGLAHELNNPSAAVVRSSQSLKKQLQALPVKLNAIIKNRMNEKEINYLNEVIVNHTSNKNEELSMLERSEKEESMLQWLHNHDIEDADKIADSLIENGFSIKELEEVTKQIPTNNVSSALNWVNQLLSTESMVREIENSAKRINDLVLSIKNYTHMDQSGEKQKVDIHKGINNTLTMLEHKIQKANVKVVRQFEENLPKPMVYRSELNQVWTNLIDNAIDAMTDVEERELKIITRQEGDFIQIEIIDSGIGIPEEEQNKIFDPFYTTKSIGEGTGLGLDLVQQVLAQHNASLKLDSKPRETIFEVCLPI